MEATLKYAEHKLNEAIRQGETDVDIAYWRGYRDCAKVMTQDHFPDSTKMVPLTLDALREMEKQVVFVDVVKKEFSRICDLKSQFGVVRPEEDRVHLFNGRSVYFASYGAWLAYACHPAHIDREVWTAEWTVDEFGHKCSKCGEYLPSGDDDITPQFCPSCGRATTSDALAELEKRLRG